MTALPAMGQGARWPSARLLYDIAKTLESASDPEGRLRHVLGILCRLVRCDRCAVLHGDPGHGERMVVVPEPAEEEQAALRQRLADLRDLIAGSVEPESGPRARGASATATHLAVPLLDLDHVAGVLFVARARAPYDDEDLCLVSVVAAQVASYLSLLDRAREKDELLAMMAHELRSPLASVVGWTELLRGGKLAEGARDRALEIIRRNAAAMSAQIEDMLDLSRTTAGELRLDVAKVELGEIAEAAVEAARPAAMAKSVGLELSRPAAAARVLGDAERLGQVVTNLVQNAIKFTPAGGSIQVQVEVDGDEARIRVTDTGVGIDPELLPHVFERFRRAAHHGHRRSAGLGLGLAIVRDLVEAHGGQVAAESGGEGMGASFTVSLPLAGG